MSDLATIDLIFIAIIGIGAIHGLMKGLLKQVATVFGLFAGLFIANMLYVSLAEELYPAVTDSVTVAQIIAFVSIWLLVPFVCVLIASLLTKILQAIHLGWVNNLLGFVAGGVIFLVVLSLCLNVIDFIDTDNKLINKTTKETSLLYYPVKDFVIGIFPVAEEVVTREYILTEL